MLLKATIEGSLKQAMQAEVARVSRGLRAGVAEAGRQAQAELRAQARAAAFTDGGKALANSWRLRVFPAASAATHTLRPAALVYSRAPDLAETFDQGAIVTPQRHKFLAVPTAVNRIPGKRVERRARTRVTPAEMYRLGGFVRRTSNPNVSLWCLPLRQQTTKRGRLKLFAGPHSEILTGRVKGLQQARRAYAAKRSFVPMFLLLKRVSLRKRLDIAAVRRAAPMAYARAATAAINRSAGAPL